MKDIIVLGIESSCDETAVAIVKNRTEILSSVVATQIDVHKEFGGVVPEVASRIHVENISMVIEEALKKAGRTDLIGFDKNCLIRPRSLKKEQPVKTGRPKQ